MAISSFGVTLKWGESAETVEKVVDIKDFGDLIGEPNLLETTTLSDQQVTNIPGIRSGDSIPFTCNYTKADFDAVYADEGKALFYELTFSDGSGKIPEPRRIYSWEVKPMGFWELLLLGVGLSMDAFAVSVCKGLAVQRPDRKTALVCGLWFGFFQAMMPVAGFFLGRIFADAIQAVDHWVAFGLLAVVGGNMIREAAEEDESPSDPDLSVKAMLPLAVATSIEALAVGVSLAMAEVSIWTAVALIGVTTFALSAAGAAVGGVFGRKYEKKAEIFGGVTLILLGLKILLENLGVL